VVPESIPQPFATIARECLRTDPERRCTVKNVRAYLDPSQSVQPHPRPRSHPRPAVKIAREGTPVNFGRIALVAAVLVLLVAGVLLLHSHWHGFAPSATEQPAATQRGSAKAAVTQQVLPDVLPAARESIHGQFIVTVRVTVDQDGQVSNAAFDSPGPSKYFARVSLEAAQKWRFQPTLEDGHPISDTWILQFKFTQAGTEVTPVLAAR
jgi:TonB family protein